MYKRLKEGKRYADNPPRIEQWKNGVRTDVEYLWTKHFRTDELLGAWLFLFGTVPAVPYTLVFFLIDPSFTYLGRHK